MIPANIRATVLVTGANGFVGQHLCRHLVNGGRPVIACVRAQASLQALPSAENLKTAVVGGYAEGPDWPQRLAEVDCVVHLAARVHVMQDRAADPLAEFRKVNVDATRALARQAARAGVRRFVYLSSIKVNGEATFAAPFRADDSPAYLDPYGQSKWEAEQALEETARETGMEWVVIRPTLVYGPGVRGNFLQLLRYTARGLPLPLGGTHNQRSLVSVYNLVDLIAEAIDHPAAAGERFLVKDPEDVSTGELIRRIATGFGRAPRLLSVPLTPLLLAAKLLGREKAAQRLFGSLVVDTEKTRRLLGWQAPMSLDRALAKTCSWYQNTAAPERGL